MDDPGLVAQIEQVLDEVRPSLRLDGGDVELVAVDEPSGRVELRLLGACDRCPASSYTLSFGIEAKLKAALPAVREVRAV